VSIVPVCGGRRPGE